MGHVDPSDVTVSSPAEIEGVNVMCAHGSNRGWPGDVSGAVVMSAAVIEAAMQAPLRCVAGPKKILPVKVGDEHLLIAFVKCIQFRIGVFLPQVEGSQVVLESIVAPIAKEPHACVDVIENEAAEV